MIRNIQLTKTGKESDDSGKLLFTSPDSWEDDGINLVLYKGSAILKNGVDYTIIDNQTLELTSKAKDSDEFNFIITRIVDPSGVYNNNERINQIDKISKKLEGKVQSTALKRIDEETLTSKIIIHSDDIWTTTISSSVSEAVKQHSAFKHELTLLVEDKTVGHSKGWYASSDGTLEGRITNWIPPEFGKGYIVRLYDKYSEEIPSSDKMGWRWDYQAGYLVIENELEYELPFRLTGYTYDGRLGVGSGTYWKEPVFAVADLPLYNNDDGDIRLIRTTNKLYRFDSLKPGWDPLDYGSGAFKDPVYTFDSLPTDNKRGDVCLVMDELNLYVFDEGWEILTGKGFDPDNYYNKEVTDGLLNEKSNTWHNHDTIYLREEEVDDIVRWRNSRADFADLPSYTENRDGDVILTRDNNTIYRWYTDDPNEGTGYWEAIFQSNFSWKTPVAIFDDLPVLNNTPGDTRLVSDIQKMYYWDGAEWISLKSEVEDHEHEQYILKTAITWKEPVETIDDLYIYGNVDGDCRLVLTTNIIYRWEDTTNEWVQVISKSKWLDAIDLLENLPSDADTNDIIFVKESSKMYYWDSLWKEVGSDDHEHDDLYYTKEELDVIINNVSTNISTHIHDGITSPQIDFNSLLNIPRFSWKNPVSLEIDLPLLGNEIGDAIAALDTKSIHVWTGEWQLISNGNFSEDDYYNKEGIDSLLDAMSAALVLMIEEKADRIHNHDDRYYSKEELDIQLSEKAPIEHDHPILPHNHDDRYPSFSDFTAPGGEGKIHWDNIINVPDILQDYWQTPVQRTALLPADDNTQGDLRLVLDDSDVYRWNGYEWKSVGHWEQPSVDFWKAPVYSKSALPLSDNIDGDIRLTRLDSKLWRWVSADVEWVQVSGGGDTIIVDDGDGDSGDQNSSTSSKEVQVYINGVQGVEAQDWEMVDDSSLRVLCEITEQDIVSVLIMGDSITRHDFRGVEGQDTITITFNSFYRKEFEIAEITSLIELPVEYNPSQNDLIVWRNGLIQQVDVDYMEKSTQSFEFILPLSIGEKIIVMVLGFTTEGKNYVREDHTAEVEQTTYDLENTYDVGMKQLLVYHNGMLQLAGDDYAEVDSVTVRFSDGKIVEGDAITFIILKGIAVNTSGTVIEYANELMLGFPSDNNWRDGYLTLTSEDNVADVIDEMNEAILELIPTDLLSFSNLMLESVNEEFSSGFVSDGNINIEGQPGDYFDYLTKSNELTLITPENSFLKADLGLIKLYLNGVEVDDLDLGSAFVEGDRDGFQSGIHYGQFSQGALGNVGNMGTNGAIRNSRNNFIQVLSIQKFGYRKIQQGSLRFKFNEDSLRHGYNYITVTHAYEDKIDTTQQFKLFLDTKHQLPSFTGTQTLYESAISSEKYVSGVRYYSIGDTFRTTFNLTNIAYTVYSAEPIIIDMPGLKPINVEFNDDKLFNMSNPPHMNDIVEYKGVFTLNEFNEFSIDGSANIKTVTPFGEGDEYNFVSKNRLVNTYTNGSSSLIEYFRDEIFRMPNGDYDEVPSTRSYVWDSTQSLSNGDAILFDKGLRYSNMSFIDYMPIQTIDYSGFYGVQTYTRAFFKNVPKNNGVFIIDGITKNDLINNKITIDIKLPSQTGWLSFNKYYEISEFDGEDGDGCLVDVVDNNFYYSSGSFSTAYSGYSIIVRINLKDDSVPVIKYLELKW